MSILFHINSLLHRSIGTYKAPLVLFFLFLFFFVVNGSWHIPSQLVISGQAASPVDVRVSWDSGSGFNEMESADVVFGKPLKDQPGNPVVKIRRIGNKHPAARSTEVRIKLLKLSQDDHANTLKAFAQQKGAEITAEGFLRLREDGSEVQVPSGRDHTSICFVADKNAGFVEIELYGDKRLYDLYADQPRDKWVKISGLTYTAGHFISRMDLPRYDVCRLQITSVESLQTFRLESIMIKSAKGNIRLPLLGSGLYSSVGFSDFPRNTRQYFHLLNLIQQILFAILSAYLTLAVLRFIRVRGGIIRVLSEGKRPVFWLMFTGCVIFFGAWLLAYWPGNFTSDSVHVWWAARNPGFFLFQHPVMNVIFYRFLQQFWDHMAVVGFIQILMISLLGSYIFYYLNKQGVSLWIIILFYFAFITSVPVGLYNISLWKDIPFALLILFWAFYFVKAVHEKRQSMKPFSRHEVVMLIMLLLALSLFRYNGLVYLFFIPTGLMMFKIISWKKFLFGLAFVLTISSVVIGIAVYKDKTSFITQQTRFYIKRMLGISFLETATRMVKQYPTVLDVNIYKKRHIWYDIWYRDKETTAWHYDFAKLKGYNEFLRYVPCEPKNGGLFAFLDQVSRHSYGKPWVYFTWNPFYMLFLFLFCGLGNYFPRTAGFGYVVLTQVLVLLFVLGPENYNWRYYYFLLLSLYFLIPIMMLDIKMRVTSTS